MAIARFAGCSPILTVMMAAVQKSTRGMTRDFSEIEHLQVSRKGLGDFVSTADKRSETILIEELSKARFDYSILSEERGLITRKDPYHTWIIDPLDGTNNFLHSIPHFAITVALKRNNEIVAGVTYDPIKDEMYWAEKGKGAFLNQRRLRVSSRKQVDECLVGVGKYPKPAEISHPNNKYLANLLSTGCGTRNYGAAALDLAYVAAGRLDGYCERGLKIWDIAAGILLVKEAGGVVLSCSEADENCLDTGNVLATNAVLSPSLKKILTT